MIEREQTQEPRQRTATCRSPVPPPSRERYLLRLLRVQRCGVPPDEKRSREDSLRFGFLHTVSRFSARKGGFLRDRLAPSTTPRPAADPSRHRRRKAQPHQPRPAGWPTLPERRQRVPTGATPRSRRRGRQAHDLPNAGTGASRLSAKEHCPGQRSARIHDLEELRN